MKDVIFLVKAGVSCDGERCFDCDMNNFDSEMSQDVIDVLLKYAEHSREITFEDENVLAVFGQKLKQLLEDLDDLSD